MTIKRIKVKDLVEFIALKTDVTFEDVSNEGIILQGNLLKLYNDKKLESINEYYINNIIPVGAYKVNISIEFGGEL